VAVAERRRPALLLDTNVVLDVLASRAPWAHEAALLLSAIEAGRARGAVAAHTVTTLHYLPAKTVGREAAVAALVRLTQIVEIVAVDREAILEAVALGLGDWRMRCRRCARCASARTSSSRGTVATSGGRGWRSRRRARRWRSSEHRARRRRSSPATTPRLGRREVTGGRRGRGSRR
jgi:predicted nucleic acid-binding protein